MANSTFTKTLSLMAYENALTPDVKNDYTLRVKTQPKSLDVTDIARETALTQGKYEPDEITLLLNKAFQAVADAVASGYIVNLPIVLIQPTASGVLLKDELSQAVDHKKVKVGASCSAGAMLRSAIASSKLEIFTQPAPVGPMLNGAVSTRAVIDDQTGTSTRAPLEAGDMCVLTGVNLKLAGTDPSVGITLTLATDATKKHFIAPNRVSPNEPKRLQFILPADMTEGNWIVKVTTQYSSSNHTVKEPRSYQMDGFLTLGEGGGSGEPEDPAV